MSVVWMTTGASTPDGATFATKVNGGGPVRVAVSDNSLMSSPVFTASQAVNAQGVAKVSITGLQPYTRYFWQVEDNAVIDTARTGQLITAPIAGTAASFRVGCSGDAGLSPSFPGIGATLDATGQRVSNHPVFDTCRTAGIADPWLGFIHMGDIHYYDLGDAFPGTVANYRTAYDDVFIQPLQLNLYSSMPFITAWDDHDYGPNNSDGTLATKANALTAYGEVIPHYPLVGVDGIYHSWQWGRVLFVLSDVRYNRSPNSDPDGPAKTMLGATQKVWMDSLLGSSNAKLLVWVNPQQWLGTATDSWASFQTEQAELVTMFANTGWAGRMCILSADYHGVAIDSGANSPGSIPVLQAAALDATPGAGSGGTYDGGVFSGRNQYGTLEVVDLGYALNVTLTGWRGTEVLTSYSFVVEGDPLPPVATGALLRTLQGSHRATFDVRLLTTYQTGPDPAGETLEISGGDVEMDGTAEVRANANILLPGENRWPRTLANDFAPYGNELFIRRGVDLGSEVLWVPLGYYRIEATEQADAPKGLIQLTCYDRMKGIRDARLIEPRTYRPDTLVSTVFEDLVGEVYPEAVIVFDDTSGLETLGREVLVEENRYEALLDLATGLGKILFWDDIGALRIDTAPTTQAIAWYVHAGFKGTQLNISRQITREGVYNAVVAMGEGSDDMPSVRAVAVDTNPNSPTFYGGRFGKVPRFYSSPFLTTQAQADAAAVELLQRSTGLPYSVDFEAVVNPALRPYDPVQVRYRDGTFEVHVMERLNIPLDESTPMRGFTRQQTLTIVGLLP